MNFGGRAGQYGHDRYDFSLPTHSPGVGQRDRRSADRAHPCEKLPVDDLVAHVGGLALAFTAAARKDFGPLTDTPPTFDDKLDDDWRTAYPKRLAELAAAFGDPAAWQGMSRAGGVDFPARWPAWWR